MASNSTEEVYKMTSNPLGYCVIINIVNFEEEKENENLERNDSIESVHLIRKAFEYLNFKVKMFQDLNDIEIKSKLNELLNKEECNFHDCFTLYIHSHGKENGFLPSNNNNNKIVEYHEIYELFSNSNCQKFIRKPKLLFFDCCRGEHFSPKFTEPDFPTLKMLVHSDLFVCYSTLRSKFSIKLYSD